MPDTTESTALYGRRETVVSVLFPDLKAAVADFFLVG